MFATIKPILLFWVTPVIYFEVTHHFPNASAPQLSCIWKLYFSDNRTQCTLYVFHWFAEQQNFIQKTSSPKFPQSNGVEQISISYIKNALQKSNGSGNISYLALIAMRELSISISSINNPGKQYIYLYCTPFLILLNDKNVARQNSMQNRPHLIKSSKTYKEFDDLASTKQLLNYNEPMTSLPNELLQ